MDAGALKPGVVVTRNQVNANQGTAQLVLTRVAPMTLMTRNVNLTVEGIQPLLAAELIPGDVNGDDDINLFDLVRVTL